MDFIGTVSDVVELFQIYFYRGTEENHENDQNVSTEILYQNLPNTGIE
jgi:hypothetical protein